MKKCTCSRSPREDGEEETENTRQSRVNAICSPCSYSEVDTYLTTKAAKINIKEEHLMDPLLFAATEGYPELIELVLRRNKDINTQDLLDRTVLHLAVSCGYKKIVQILLQHGAKLDVEDFYGYTALCEAVWQQSTEVVELLVNAGATPSDEHCLLHYSVLQRHYDITKLLLHAGANPNFIDGNGKTPLIIASLLYDIKLVELLLENGAIPHGLDRSSSTTPLHILALNHSDDEDCNTTFEDFLSLLIEYDVDLNVCCPVLGTAFTKSLHFGKYKNAQLLVQMGADVNKIPEGVVNSFSNLKLCFERMRYPLIRLMVAAGYNFAKEVQELQLPRYYLQLSWNNENTAELDSMIEWLVEKCRSPYSLADICRLYIRKHFGTRISIAVPNMNIPKTLQQFLMLEGIANEENIDIMSFLQGPE